MLTFFRTQYPITTHAIAVTAAMIAGCDGDPYPAESRSSDAIVSPGPPDKPAEKRTCLAPTDCSRAKGRVVTTMTCPSGEVPCDLDANKLATISYCDRICTFPFVDMGVCPGGRPGERSCGYRDSL
jgi:hypothetical protein